MKMQCYFVGKFTKKQILKLNQGVFVPKQWAPIRTLGFAQKPGLKN